MLNNNSDIHPIKCIKYQHNNNNNNNNYCNYITLKAILLLNIVDVDICN